MAASLASRNSRVKTHDQTAVGETLRALFDAALAAAEPSRALGQRIPTPVRGRTVVVGAGKASAAMASAFEAGWSGPLEGLVITRYGHALPCSRIEVVEASHPVPDVAGERAAGRILALARGLGPNDQLVFLASGGGSALLSLPAPGLTLDDKQAVTRSLLRSGATITEINTVRKHLSAIKGGRLAAAAAPARILTLAISDVPGDDPAVIASGPTFPDPTTFADAQAVLAKYRITEPPAVIAHLAAAEAETPKPGDPIFSRSRFELIACCGLAISSKRLRLKIGSPGFGVSASAAARWAMTAGGAVMRYLARTACASAKVVGSGNVGPEAITAGSSPGTSEIARVRMRAGAAAAARRPPLIAERCFRTVLISPIVAPARSTPRGAACLSTSVGPGSGNFRRAEPPLDSRHTSCSAGPSRRARSRMRRAA